MPSRLRHILRQSREEWKWKQDLQLNPLYFSCLCTPAEGFMYPRVGLPPVKTASLKDAKMVLAIISDRVPIYAGGIGHVKDWFEQFRESTGGKSRQVKFVAGRRMALDSMLRSWA